MVIPAPRNWHTYLSVEQRCRAAYQTRYASYDYQTPLQGRGKRLVADVQMTRRVAQDNAVGRYLDAAFAPVVAERPLMAPPPSWREQAARVACWIATALRQVVDAAACIVGVMVGLSRFGTAINAWGALRSEADPCALRGKIATLVREQIAKHTAECPLDDGELAHQFRVDHHRQFTHLVGAPLQGGEAYEGHAQNLLAFCDNDPIWAQSASLLLTQFPNNCAYEALLTDGRLRLGDLGVGMWLQSTDPEAVQTSSAHHVLRDGDTLQVRVSCTQRLAVLQVGQQLDHALGGVDMARLEPIYCDGQVRFQTTLRVPRPATGADVGAFYLDKFDLRSSVSAPVLT